MTGIEKTAAAAVKDIPPSAWSGGSPKPTCEGKPEFVSNGAGAHCPILGITGR